MKIMMVSAAPEKPGTIIDPGFVVYTGAASGAALTESGGRDHRHKLDLL